MFHVDQPVRILTSALAIFICGCATMESELEYAARSAEPGFIQQKGRVYWSPDNVEETCLLFGAKKKAGDSIQACSDPHGRINPGACTIIIPKNSPPWLIGHEEAHCRYGRWHGLIMVGPDQAMLGSTQRPQTRRIDRGRQAPHTRST